jgi:hypothetical protein
VNPSRSGTTEPRRLCLPALLLPALLLGLAACGGDNLLLPTAGQPARISVFSGNNQIDTVGKALPLPLVVMVTDPGDRPVEGVEVVFVVPDGAQIAPGDTIVTGPDGKAAVTYTLSLRSGDQVVQAHARPVVSSPDLSTTITAKALPEPAVALVPAANVTQRGEVSTALAESLAVKAVDRFENGVEGVDVTWEAEGGSVSAGLVTTGPDGRSAIQRIMGDSPGSYPTTASAAGLDGSPIEFSATAVAAPSPALVLVVQPSPTVAAGAPFPQQPELQLLDPVGAQLPQPDVRVTVGITKGGGSLGGSTSAQSDANGRVRFDDLSIRGDPGDRTLIFAAEGFSPVSSSSIKVEAGAPSTGRSSASVEDGTAGDATSISIRLEDEFGTRIEGAAGSISVAVSGANEVAHVEVTDQGNGVYSAAYTPRRVGTDQIAVLVDGRPIEDSPLTSTVSPGPASTATTTAEIRVTRFIFTTVNISVTTRDSEGNPLGRGGDRVEYQLNGGSVFALDDNDDGTYSDSFSTFGDVETIGILLNGQPIAGSPFRPR